MPTLSTPTDSSMYSYAQGRTQGEGPGARALPLGPTQHYRFSGPFPLNYVICISEACVRKTFAIWEDRTSLQHGSRLTLG